MPDRHARATVDFRKHKWGRVPKYGGWLEPLGSDEFGTWYGSAVGSVVVSHANGRSFETTRSFVAVTTDGAMSLAHFFEPSGSERSGNQVYIDVGIVTIEDHTLTIIDLDLDVVVRSDGSVELEDEDEFLEHQRTYGYPAEVITAAQGEADELIAAIRSGIEPYVSVGRARAAAYAEQARE